MKPPLLNPLTIVWLLIGGVISILLVRTGGQFFICLAGLGILVAINRKNLIQIYQQVRPFFVFLPLMSLFYLGFSFLLTDQSAEVILTYALIALGRLFLMIMLMAIYLQSSGSTILLTAIRSIWWRIDKPWKKVEDFFLFLSLILRFYPLYQKEWEFAKRAQQALGIENVQGRLKHVRSAIQNLPGIIIQSYRKAENTAGLMILRGYGTQIPRGVAYPIKFRILDRAIIVISFVGYYWLYSYDSL
ncbi:MAG: energy-coupling factor transporter transmembrane component T [Candidatus Neomarinimicrobiota bacterium]